MDRQFGTTSEFVILGSSVVSTSVTSSDLLNTTLVSPGNAVKAHRQPIQIPWVVPDILPARKQLYGPSNKQFRNSGNTVKAHRQILVKILVKIPETALQALRRIVYKRPTGY